MKSTTVDPEWLTYSIARSINISQALTMFQTLTNKSHKLFIYNLEQLQFYPLEGATGSAFRFHFRHMISPNAGSPLTLKINNQNFSETARNAKHDKLISLSGCKGDGKAGRRLLSPAPTLTFRPLAHVCQDPSIQQEWVWGLLPSVWFAAPALSPGAQVTLIPVHSIPSQIIYQLIIRSKTQY